MEWKYYNHAMVPKGCEPHEVVDTSKIHDGKIWKTGGGVRLCSQDGHRISIVELKQIGGM